MQKQRDLVIADNGISCRSKEILLLEIMVSHAETKRSCYCREWYLMQKQRDLVIGDNGISCRNKEILLLEIMVSHAETKRSCYWR